MNGDSRVVVEVKSQTMRGGGSGADVHRVMERRNEEIEESKWRLVTPAGCVAEVSIGHDCDAVTLFQTAPQWVWIDGSCNTVTAWLHCRKIFDPTSVAGDEV